MDILPITKSDFHEFRTLEVNCFNWIGSKTVDKDEM